MVQPHLFKHLKNINPYFFPLETKIKIQTLFLSHACTSKGPTGQLLPEEALPGLA